MNKLFPKAALVCTVLSLTAVYSHASEVTFEDQPAGSSVFGGPEQTLVYNFGSLTATFSGGLILTDETSQSTDNSNVYATSSFGSASMVNPLTVTFNQPIVNFQIDILNALAGNYIMSDNVGNVLNFNLATTGGSAATEGFAAAGTQVTIDYTGPGLGTTTFDFAIDNVTFDQPLSNPTGTPEPSSICLLGTGVLAMACRFRRKLGIA